MTDTYDYIIVGSGFGGSVSAYRLSQKGYRVLVVEKGRRYTETDFSEGTTRPGRWLWLPRLGMRGIMKLTFLRHVAVMSGVGVGGGSLVYAATLPMPKDGFYDTGSWAGLRDWKTALAPHYRTAQRMLGATRNPTLTSADNALRDLARDIGREDAFRATDVGIFFGDAKQAGAPVADPFFDGEGPMRRGCIQCGDCMTGCRYNAKNSLDKNYLYLAEKLGATVLPDTEVTDVRPAGLPDGSQGYFIATRTLLGRARVFRAGGVVFSGGVMGTVPLLLKLRDKGSLPRLSRMLGHDVRTNNESLSTVTATGDNPGFNEGVAIGSILHPDEHSHLEPVVLGPKSGLWRFLALPMATGKSFAARMKSLAGYVLRDPVNMMRAMFTRDFGGRTVILLFMQHLDSAVTLKRGRFGRLATKIEPHQTAPTADLPEANELTRRMEKLVGGKAMRGFTEVVLGAPSTAHILGGSVIGADADSGVIDSENRVFNYANMLVCDGSAISANPGVNPSLSITALAEHAMSKIPANGQRDVRQIENQPVPEPETVQVKTQKVNA
ncbi:Cholesterol oxidase [Ruegeria sp. THAF57]|uniref:FAD-dependent oxidoreductase n=1 Tax=Ruegeria sp. THAF57 TaxID=2744555 RepID=UPI0015DF50B4|nr:FAD-dependent oxidoreductase [Ruegeria sp. THAF57]CAD0187228.1 Cholesterol oxidase [Ruegeria sp. THAF57]